ncbi:site-specific DNA-methyltransferase [Leucobacter sp. cx-328]|nr:site-specific DNA-methyltransferase [Leucobacter sp. cx-328]
MHDDDIRETPSTTPNFRTELAAQLAELVPEAIADGKVDVAKLQELLDGDAAEGNERFGLFWPGKKRALRVAQEQTTATLKPDFETSKDWDKTQNVFIEGDNLEVLKILQRHYHGKIKMIYIDPPYNTGKDFVYNDNFTGGVQHYLEWTQQVSGDGKKLSSNSESEGRYHSNWLNMMYPRLKLARNLLTDDGVMFISIDGNEVANLRKLCVEVFGEHNFVGELVWVKKEKASGVPPKNMLLPNFEYLMVLQRRKPFRFKGQERSLASYKQDADGRWWRTMPIQATGAQNSWFSIINPVNGKSYYGNWAFSEDRIKQMVEDGKIRFPKNDDGKPVQVVYADEMANDRSPLFSNLGRFDSETSTKQLIRLFGGKKYFDFPKPLDLIKFLVSQATDDNDIVLDFFSGSATTAHAIMEVNREDGGARRYIQVQLPEPLDGGSEAAKAGYKTIPDISRLRIDLAAAEIQSDNQNLLVKGHPVDTGYRSFRLVDSNFSKWRVSSEIEPDALEQRLLGLRDSADDNATPDDLFTEILLKQGFSLTEQISPFEVAGLEMRAVLQADGDIAVLAYLDEHRKPTLDQLRAMVDEIHGGKIIVLEDAFHGDDELKTNLAQLCKSNGIELWTA